MIALSKDDHLFRQPGAEGVGDPAALLHGDVTDGDEGTDIQGAHSREGWKRETWLIYRLMNGSFSSKSSNHHKSQTIRALGTWKFLQNVHHMSCVMCHMSPVTCHLSLEKKYKKIIIIFFFGFWTNWWSQLVEGLLSTGPMPSSLHLTGLLAGCLHMSGCPYVCLAVCLCHRLYSISK